LGLGDDPPFIHNLTALFGRLTDRGAFVAPFLPLEAFTVFAVQFRYDAALEPMNLDRQVWQKQAETLVEHVAAICAALP